MNERISLLKKLVFDTQPEICSERAVIVTEAYKEFSSCDISILRAKALEKILKKMSIYILPGELIVGNHSGKLRAAPVFPEFDVNFVKYEIGDFGKRPGDPFTVSDDTKEKLLGIIPFWEQHGTIKEINNAMLPRENKLAGGECIGVIDNGWSLENSEGHVAVDYPKLLKFGLKGIINEADAYLSRLDLADPETIYKKSFYESIKVVANAVIDFSHRFADLALKTAQKEPDSRRKSELLKISEICNTVPEFPARTFYEAIQSVWFVQLCIQIDANGHSISMGRFDQYMYSFYKNDIGHGHITNVDILELIESFWIKLSSLTKLRSWPQTQISAGYPLFQNVTIGGQTSDKKDASNELTFLCLDATEELKLFQPTLTARIFEGSSHEYLTRCAEILSHGTTMPSLLNDGIIIKSLMNRGVSEEDAYNYCLVGCVEPSVPGKWGARHGASLINIVKVLELALNNGKDPRTGIQLCKGTGDLSEFMSFRDLVEAYELQLKYYVRQHIIQDNILDYIWERHLPTPLISCLVDDCMQRGKEIKKGGAVYDYTGGQTGGIGTLADSLAAIKKMVFDEKVISASELKKHLDNDFEGIEGEKVRQILLNKAPKYGRGDDYVDQIAREVYSLLLKEVEKYKNTRFGRGPIGGRFHHSSVTTSANVPFGAIVGATPDGRKAFTPISDTESPVHGVETDGPTGVALSASKLEHLYESGGSILNLKFNRSIFEGNKNLDKLIDLILTYFSLDGMEIQINMISADLLRKAQKNPVHYKDLLIRVAGYSAYFVDLDHGVQDDIIDRTEYMSV